MFQILQRDGKNLYLIYCRLIPKPFKYTSQDIHSYIVIYYPKAKNKQWILETLIHEYTHYLQDGEEMKRMYDEEGYEYDTHPFELEAIAAEKDWKLFVK